MSVSDTAGSPSRQACPARTVVTALSRNPPQAPGQRGTAGGQTTAAGKQPRVLSTRRSPGTRAGRPARLAPQPVLFCRADPSPATDTPVSQPGTEKARKGESRADGRAGGIKTHLSPFCLRFSLHCLCFLQSTRMRVYDFHYNETHGLNKNLTLLVNPLVFPWKSQQEAGGERSPQDRVQDGPSGRSLGSICSESLLNSGGLAHVPGSARFLIFVTVQRHP